MQDAWICKVSNAGHQQAVTEFGAQLGNCAKMMNSKFTPRLSAGGSHTKTPQVTCDDSEIVLEKRTDPGQASRLGLEGDKDPLGAIQVEVSNRSPPELAKHVHGLFASWSDLCCVTALKICPCAEDNETFSCVCFPFGRKRHDQRFWNANSVDLHKICEKSGKSFDVEPVQINCPPPYDCPDDLENHFKVFVPKADACHGPHPPFKKKKITKQKGIQDLLDDASMEIDLHSVLEEIDFCKDKNFVEL